MRERVVATGVHTRAMSSAGLWWSRRGEWGVEKESESEWWRSGGRREEQGAAVARSCREERWLAARGRAVYASSDMDGQPFLQVSRAVLGGSWEREEDVGPWCCPAGVSRADKRPGDRQPWEESQYG